MGPFGPPLHVASCAAAVARAAPPRAQKKKKKCRCRCRLPVPVPAMLTQKIKTILQYLSFATFGSTLFSPRAELLPLRQLHSCQRLLHSCQRFSLHGILPGTFFVVFCFDLNNYSVRCFVLICLIF